MVVSMKDSEAFASKHGLTVGRRAPDTSEGPDLPTDTCEVGSIHQYPRAVLSTVMAVV